MKYYGGKELAASFRTVRANTIKIAEEIPEDKYGVRITPDTRTVAQLLAHIAVGPTFALQVHGNKITDMKSVNFPELMQKVRGEEATPRSKAELIAMLTTGGATFASFLEGLSDEFLAEQVAMMPGGEPAVKTRFEMLLSAKEHEMHHRAQLMMIERMVGVVPHLTRQFQERQQRMAQAQTQGAAH